MRSMLQCAVTHARRTSPHLNTKYKKLNRNKKKFKKINPQAKEVRRMLQQNLNQKNKIIFFFSKKSFSGGYFDPRWLFRPWGGRGPPPRPNQNQKAKFKSKKIFFFFFSKNF